MTLHLPLEDEARPGDKGHTYKDNRCCVTAHKVMYQINLPDANRSISNVELQRVVWCHLGTENVVLFRVVILTNTCLNTRCILQEAGKHTQSPRVIRESNPGRRGW